MTIAADAIPPLLSEARLQAVLLAYDLPQPIELHFLRRGYNDHYLVAAGGQPFILRVYLTHKPYLIGAHDFQAVGTTSNRECRPEPTRPPPAMLG